MTARPRSDNPEGDEFKIVTDIASLLSCGQVAESDLHFGQLRIDIPLLMRAAEIVDAIQKVFTRPYPRWVRSGFDLSLSISFLSDPEDTRYLYVTFYSEVPGFDRVWRSIPGVQTYSYWNNTDRPSNLSSREWDCRSEVWDRVLGDAAPAEVGITWTHRPRELTHEVLGRRQSPATAWLTDRRVTDRLIRMAEDKEGMRARRAELYERLAGPRIGVIAKRPEMPEVTLGAVEPQGLEAAGDDA